MMARNWTVSLPVTGIAYVEVVADSEEEAINKALDEVSVEHLETWSAVRQIVTGNVFRGELNEAEAEDLGGEP